MTLTSGTRLGPYEVLAPLGAGGMGEVYKARDTRLDRIVAVKVLPAHFADDRQFRERFEREARAISQLNHPSICTLFDVGTQDGSSFLVMEHLEGETLMARLAKGPLSIDRVIAFGIQIADALTAAHRRGILHRDLKPANVMITASGVKLLDFGLAKVVAPAVASDLAGAETVVVSGATVPMTAPLTQQGMTVGTIPYMAPEVVSGEAADARADIWGLGCVLYEMLTARMPFAGKTQAGLIGSILKDEPAAVSTVQPLVPPALERIVRTCLTKDRNQRVQSAHDVLLNLQWIAEAGSAAGIPAPVLAGPRSLERVLLIAAALLLGVAGVAAWLLKPGPDIARVPTRFVHTLPADQRLRPDHAIAIAPDGSFFVYATNQQLYVRRMDQLDAQPIKGTEGDSIQPVISPDGSSVAYFVLGRSLGQGLGREPATLTRIPITGGEPTALATVQPPTGASWRDATIVIGQGEGGIVSIPERGGTIRQLISLQDGDAAMANPQLLDDGRVLFTVRGTKAPSWNEAQIVVQAPGSGTRTLAIDGGHDARITPDGTLVYVRDGALLGAPFDERSGKITSEPVPLIVRVDATVDQFSGGPGNFAISPKGQLIYVPATTSGATARTLVWVDRQRREQPIAAPPRGYVFAQISPDGSRIALEISDGSVGNIWIFDPARDILERLSKERDELHKGRPNWSRDGRFVIYPQFTGTSPRQTSYTRRRADGTGSPESLGVDLDGTTDVAFMGLDDASLVFFSRLSSTFYSLPLTGTKTPQPLFANPGVTSPLDLSPDGRWVAYHSNESGRMEVVVRPFPAVETGRWQVSTGGGTRPLWSRDGRELFYMSTDLQLTTVPIESGPGFKFGKPSVLFDASPFRVAFGVGRTWDVGPDGRFVFMKNPPAVARVAPAIVVVEHWLDEAKSRLGRK